MSRLTLDRPRRSVTPLIVVTSAAVVFTILLVLVVLRWAPLESADHDSAVRLNSLIAGRAALVAVVKAVTVPAAVGPKIPNRPHAVTADVESRPAARKASCSARAPASGAGRST